MKEAFPRRNVGFYAGVLSMYSCDMVDTQTSVWYDNILPLVQESRSSKNGYTSFADDDDEDIADDEDEDDADDDNDMDYKEEYGIDEEDEFDDEFGDDEEIDDDFLSEEFFDDVVEDDDDDFIDEDI